MGSTRLIRASKGGAGDSFDSGADSSYEGGNASAYREVGGGFQRIGKAGFMGQEEESFGPVRARAGINFRPNDTGMSGAALNGVRKVDGASNRGAGDNGFGKRGTVVGVKFIDVEAVSFPVFVQAKAEIERRLLVQPGDVSEDFRRLGTEILAVEVKTLGILTPLETKAEGIETRAEPQIDVGGPVIFPEKLAHR